MSSDAAPPGPVDRQPAPWTGRHDGDDPSHTRWWQGVHLLAEAPSHQPSRDDSPPFELLPSSVRPVVFLGFASDAGVLRNQGRPGAASGPQAIRSALAPLAFHLNREVKDAGDIVVEGDGDLEAGQSRAGTAISHFVDSGHLCVVLGGGHETAYASYLGLAGTAAVRNGQRLGVLNLDAHFDLRQDVRPTSGTPFLQMAKSEAAVGRTLEYAVLGISEPSNTRALFQTAQELGVAFLLDEDCTAEATHSFVADFLSRIDVLYLTIDLDVLPSAVAPGVSAPAAFGVPLAIISALCRQVAASGKLFHADVAELNPTLDADSRTARVAARLIATLLR